MVFSSCLFIFFFLPLALLGYYTAPKKLRHLMLTIFSYIFYGWANPWFCLLTLFNTSVDYTNDRLMGANPARKKLFVTISIVCDLAIHIAITSVADTVFFVIPTHKYTQKRKKTSPLRGFRVDFARGMRYIIRINS